MGQTLNTQDYEIYRALIEATAYGALKIIKDGWETEAIPEINRKNVEKISFLRKIFGSFL